MQLTRQASTWCFITLMNHKCRQLMGMSANFVPLQDVLSAKNMVGLEK